MSSSFQGGQSGSSGAGPSSSAQEEFTVRIPRDTRRKFTMMKFGNGSSVDFSRMGDQSVKIERENNLKEYKTANDLDLLPKFGAGSEYGRDQREESRRKKYGIMLKRYNPADQPWHLKIGSGKQAKRFKGVREGTISENTSYYIFTKASDGAFEAFPVEEWYNFSPILRYKYLNSEEAEEEYTRRDKTLNYFTIMVKKRMKKEEDMGGDDDDDEDGMLGKKSKKGKKSQKKKKDLILTDMEDWDDMRMSDDDDEDDEDRDDDEDGGAKKKKQKGNVKKTVKNSKKNSDDEAVEESDEGDYDDREVDYMSDSGSSSSLSGPEGDDDKDKKYDEKGVDEEAGLRNILDSEAEDEEEEEAEKEDMEEEPEEKEEKKEEKKKGGDDDSSSSSSEDDSDIEKDAKLASAIFLQKEKKEKKEKKDKTDQAGGETSQKRDNPTPTPDKQKDKGVKRKADKVEGKSPSLKRHKSDDSEGITEDAIRRYLMRKPMTTKDLLQKFKSKKLNMSNEKITHVIVGLLKKINPDKTTIHKKLYLSLKKPE